MAGLWAPWRNPKTNQALHFAIKLTDYRTDSPVYSRSVPDRFLPRSSHSPGIHVADEWAVVLYAPDIPGNRAAQGLATQRLGATSRLRIVDAILSGTHERGSSHYELLRAFVDDETLGRIDQELNAHHYRTHEFGDSVFLEKADNAIPKHHDAWSTKVNGPFSTESSTVH